MEIVIKAGISSRSQMFQFIREIFYSCLWPVPRFGCRNAKTKRCGKQSLPLLRGGVVGPTGGLLLPRMGGEMELSPPVWLQQAGEEPNCTCGL